MEYKSAQSKPYSQLQKHILKITNKLLKQAEAGTMGAS